MGYGTFYPDSTYTAPPCSAATKGGNYQTMPPPTDQESPYSYGYGEEKKKMLTQNENQGGDYSMYSTAYPSSVTGNQGYNSNYGEMILKYPCAFLLLLTLDQILERTDGIQQLLFFDFCRLGKSAVLGGAARFRHVSGLRSTKPGLVLWVQQPKLLASTDSQLTLSFSMTLLTKTCLFLKLNLFFPLLGCS